MSKETKHEQRISKDNCSQKGKIKQLLKMKGNLTSASIKKMLIKTTSSKFSLVTFNNGWKPGCTGDLWVVFWLQFHPSKLWDIGARVAHHVTALLSGVLVGSASIRYWGEVGWGGWKQKRLSSLSTSCSCQLAQQLFFIAALVLSHCSSWIQFVVFPSL